MDRCIVGRTEVQLKQRYRLVVHSTMQSSLHMTSFHANAPGNDSDNINGEYIRVTNTTPNTLNLVFSHSKYQATHPFPNMNIPPGHTVKVHSERLQSINPENNWRYIWAPVDQSGTMKKIKQPFMTHLERFTTNANTNPKQNPRTRFSGVI